MSFLMTALRVHIYGKIASLDREIFVKFLFIHLGVRNCLQKIDHNCLFVIYRERLHSSLRHGIMKQHHDHLVSNLTFYRLFIDSNSGALFFFLFLYISIFTTTYLCCFVVHYLIDIYMFMSSNMLWVEKSKLILQNVFEKLYLRKSCLKYICLMLYMCMDMMIRFLVRLQIDNKTAKLNCFAIL